MATRPSYNPGQMQSLDAADKMSFGDVLLIEAQEYDPEKKMIPLWPVEIADVSYDTIRLATAAGIVVVEAGANGG